MQSIVSFCMDLLPTWFTTHKNETIAGEIAQQCRIVLVQRMVCKSKSPTQSQMRGYIRAYSTNCVKAAIKQRSDLKKLSSAQVSKIIHLAKECLIEMAVREAQPMPPTLTAKIAHAA
jgi:hypothetical protein